MRIPLLCLIILTGILQHTNAQQKPAISYRLQVINDNDLYMLQLQDGYYSNGIDINFSLINYNSNNKKQITTWQLTQKIFTPQGRGYFIRNGIDRPFAGYLHSAYIKTKFISVSKMLRYGASVGTIGKQSLAEALQNLSHSFIGIDKHIGWQHQISNEVNIQLQAKYVTQVTAPVYHDKIVIYPYTQAQLGNCFTHAAGGCYFVVGKAESLHNSGLFGAYTKNNLQPNKYRGECFIYYRPQVLYQWYNATIQGGMFERNNQQITLIPKQLMFEQTLGFIYNKQNNGLQLGITFQSKETTVQQKPQWYGTVGYEIRW